MNRKHLFCILAVLALLFTLVACDSDKSSEPTYTVMVPQFAEGNNKDSKAGIQITGEMMGDTETVQRFFSYRVAPPVTGFTEQKIAKGSKINTSLFGNPISLTMTLASGGSFIFEGSTDSEYIKVEISKDNKTFNYVHSMILDVQGGGDEYDVVMGAGEIKSANHFDSYGTAYYLGAGGDAARYKFLLHGKEGGKTAWYCYNGVKKESTSAVTFTSPLEYAAECTDIVDTRVSEVSDVKQYVASFDKNKLDFSSLSLVTPADYLTDTSVLTDSEVIGLCSIAGVPFSQPVTPEGITTLRGTITTMLADAEFSSQFTYLYILTTNGLGKARADADACKTAINSWPTFSSWDIDESLDHWFPAT